ncbi:MAG TPA: hypothetical protein VHE83_12230 [Mycobacteriales bacterium]|nr:hypothetical protein [Mycobacteriales bacterium]
MRRWLLVLAPALAVTACGSQQSASRAPAADVETASASPTPAASVIPWIDAPVAIASPSPTPLPSGVPLCSAGDVTARAGQHGVGLGSYHLQLVFLARPGVRCALRYGPLVVGIRANGTTKVLSPANSEGYRNPVVVVSGKDGAEVDLSAGDACDARLAHRSDSFPTARVSLPGGGAVDIAVPDGFEAICGSAASYFESLVPAPAPRASPLTASIAAPATVARGAELDYTVTLTNTGAAAYDLTPCPVYREFVTTATTQGISESEQVESLNCSVVEVIPPRSSVTFAMRLDIRNDQQPGPSKFGWWIESADDSVTQPTANAPLTVVSG